MAQRDESHAPSPRSGRLLRRTTGGLVLAVLAAAGAAYPLDLGERLGVAFVPVEEPAAIAPPPGLELPAARVAPAVAAGLAEGRADPAAVARALRARVRAEALGRRVVVVVAEARSGRTVFRTGPAVVTPASTLKLLTAAAALDALGPERRFATTVVRHGREVVLVGGGDPLLTRTPGEPTDYPVRADLTTLARRTAAALVSEGVTRVRLGYDFSLFSGPSIEPTWEADYIPDDVVSPITSLWVDQGRERLGFSDRSPDPAFTAAAFFADALRKRGVRIAGDPLPTAAPPEAAEVASVESAPVGQLVQHMLEVSDNETAEVLARHVAIARGEPASFRGGTAAVLEALRARGVRLQGAQLYDASGLSRDNRLHFVTLLDVLKVAQEETALRAVVSGLPVAGFSGSLAYRFDRAPRLALGQVRAKTGTLTGVHGLAGTVRTRDGVLLDFVAVADRVRKPRTEEARADLDALASALALCLCR